ncbi:MAG: zf-HC2 domain-containing protein [Pyrinomonadaceae bacterium]
MHISNDNIQGFQNGTLPSDELLYIDQHLADCGDCSERVRLDARFQGSALELRNALLGEYDHLNYREIEAYVDTALSREDILRVQGHLDTCERCLADVYDLRSVAAEPEESTKAGTGSHFFDRLRGLFASFPLRYASAGVGLVAAISLGYLFWSSNSAKPEVDVAAITNPSVTESKPLENLGGTKEEPLSEIPVSPPVRDAGEPHDELPQKQPLVASLTDGGRQIGLSNMGEFAGYETVPSKYRKLAENSLRTGKLLVADLSDLNPPSGTTMGPDDVMTQFNLSGPIGKVVDTTQPTLSWEPIAGDVRYRVEVFDPAFNKVAESPELGVTSWQPKLQRGRVYSWQVVATTSDGEITAPHRPQPEARFKVLDNANSSSIAALKQSHPNAHLLLAAAYADAGLVNEAKLELKKLAAKNPRSKIPKSLTNNLNR